MYSNFTIGHPSTRTGVEMKSLIRIGVSPNNTVDPGN